MCGIAGFIGRGDNYDIERMLDAIRHRGPDDRGVFKDGDTHLGHQRLSIVDLSAAGHQPMSNVSGDVTIVFNGEIYNFAQQRERLLKSGRRFRSSSDTEVILALYEEKGEECFKELDGMFALAIWDRAKGQLLLARDRMGKKPLYWTRFGDTLVFGSELKSVLAHSAVRHELSPEALALYLAYEYVPTPLSIFKDIFKARPASYIKYHGGQITEHEFWDRSFLTRDPVSRPMAEETSELDVLLRQATNQRLMADVPLGLFLSGGLDSSTIAYYASSLLRERGEGPLRTFSIGFKEAGFDESEYAKMVADHLGCEHHSHVFTADDALALLPELSRKLDEPFADSSILPTALLSRFTRQEVTVALGGDGGDELFLGYDTMLAHKLAAWYGRVPMSLHRFIEYSVGLLPTSHRYMSLDFKMKRFLRGAQLPMVARDQAWMGSFSPNEINGLLSPELAQQTRSLDFLDSAREYAAQVSGDELRQLSWMYARTYMMDGVMVKADRASMYSSLEVRSPFLATSVVEFALSLPSSSKLRGTTRKFILKKLMEGKLPRDIVHRKKKGFGAPVGTWLCGPLLPLVKEKLSRERLGKQGIFTPGAVDKLVLEHESGMKDNRKELWTLLMFQLWYDAWHG